MAQMRGSAGYGIGQSAPFGGSSSESQEANNALEAIREQTSKIEDLLDTYNEPIKPYALFSSPFGESSAGAPRLLT